MEKDPRIGRRIEMHPATDLWMRGARFGNVVRIGRARVSGGEPPLWVKLDKLAKVVRVAPGNLTFID